MICQLFLGAFPYFCKEKTRQMEKTLRHWMLMALTALCIGGLFTACEEKEEEQEPNTSDNPTNPENDEIYSKGGTITFEDLTLTFPSGAYSEGWGSEVEVKKRPKGSVISGDEISDCYYVSFFGDTHKPITVKLPSKKDTDIMLAVKSKGFIPSSGKLTMVDMISMFPTTYSNGTYTAQLPAFDFSKGFSEEDFHNLEQSTDVDLTIALVKTDDGNANVRESRAARTEKSRPAAETEEPAEEAFLQGGTRTRRARTGDREKRGARVRDRGDLLRAGLLREPWR